MSVEGRDVYFLTIRPIDTSDPGSKQCVLTVVKYVTVIQEPIMADHANDEKALLNAREDVAERLSIPIDSIGY
jgi:hypothetical protein